MHTITLSVEIPPDHHLELDLPPDLPTGAARITIQPQSAPYEVVTNPAREAARAKLLAAGKLVTNIHPPPGTRPLTLAERQRLGQLPPGSRPSEELVNDDRGTC